MEMPLVSVIIPVFNGERFLGEALASVFAQDYSPLEVIVIDDGSTDATPQVAKSFAEVRYLNQVNQGSAVARNAGLTLAHGEFIAFLDADDLWTADKLQVQLGFLRLHPEVAYSVAHVKFVVAPGTELPTAFRKEWLESNAVGYFLSALVARRSLFEQVGNFDPALRISEDVDWFARVKDQQTPVYVAPNVLLHKRVHEGNISLSQHTNNSTLLKAIARTIQRKRGRGLPHLPA